MVRRILQRSVSWVGVSMESRHDEAQLGGRNRVGLSQVRRRNRHPSLTRQSQSAMSSFGGDGESRGRVLPVVVMEYASGDAMSSRASQRSSCCVTGQPA